MEEYIVDTTEDNSSPICFPYGCMPNCPPNEDPGGCFPDICVPGPDD